MKLVSKDELAKRDADAVQAEIDAIDPCDEVVGTTTKHRCPPYCHRCPDMDGDVMPGCMGTAAMAHDGRDMTYCTCVRPQRSNVTRLQRLEERLDRLEKLLRPSGKRDE